MSPNSWRRWPVVTFIYAARPCLCFENREPLVYIYDYSAKLKVHKKRYSLFISLSSAPVHMADILTEGQLRTLMLLDEQITVFSPKNIWLLTEILHKFSWVQLSLPWHDLFYFVELNLAHFHFDQSHLNLATDIEDHRFPADGKQEMLLLFNFSQKQMGRRTLSKQTILS